jgi:hypothetical protein
MMSCDQHRYSIAYLLLRVYTNTNNTVVLVQMKVLRTSTVLK